MGLFFTTNKYLQLTAEVLKNFANSAWAGLTTLKATLENRLNIVNDWRNRSQIEKRTIFFPLVMSHGMHSICWKCYLNISVLVSWLKEYILFTACLLFFLSAILLWFFLICVICIPGNTFACTWLHHLWQQMRRKNNIRKEGSGKGKMRTVSR